MFKTITKKLSWQAIEEDMSFLIARFPLSVVAIFVLFGISTMLVHLAAPGGDVEYVFFAKILLTALFVALLSYAGTLLQESWGVNSIKKKLGFVVGTIFLGFLYYWYIPSTIETVPFEVLYTIFGILGLVAVASFAARFQREYLKNDYRETSFYLFVLSQFLSMAQGLLVTIFAFALGAATLGSLDALFSLSIPGEWYAQWWTTTATLIGPLYFLSHVPKDMSEKEIGMETFGKFLRFIIMYVALPFIAIYFVILYAYSIKVLVNFTQWPEGIVAWMVIMFSFFGFIIYFLSYNVKEEKFVALFRKWFPLVLTPQLLMLFYAIGLRVVQHGFTINRYLVVVFGVWITILCVYYIFSKQKALFVIPASLFIALLFALIGPWGVFAVSERSQTNKLTSLFEQYDISTESGVRTLSGEELGGIPDEDKNRMSSAVQYVCENHGCDALRELFGDNYSLAINEDTTGYRQSRALLEQVGLPEYVSPVRNLDRADFRSWYANYSGFTIDTTETESITHIQSYTQEKIPFGVTATDRVVINYVQDGVQKSIDLADDLTVFITTNAIDDFGFRNTNKPEPLVFSDGVFYLLGMQVEMQDDKVTDFSNVEGYLVINR